MWDWGLEPVVRNLGFFSLSADLCGLCVETAFNAENAEIRRDSQSRRALLDASGSRDYKLENTF